MDKSSLADRDARVIWHPYTQHLHSEIPIPITRGEGALLFDEKGDSYIDAVSSWWVNLHGHANPYIAEKIYRQALALEQVIFTRFTHEPAIQLAERLLDILPGNLSKIFYSDNGSTAVEVALKMALQFWKNKGFPERNKILTFSDAYHGDTFGAMSVSGRGLFTNAFRDLLFDVICIDTPRADNLDSIRSILKLHKGRVAAFIYEPVLQAAGGMKIYQAEFMNILLDEIHAENILCIADEVLTGFGRTGPLFASESFTHGADLVCLSKGLTGGTMALGVTASSTRVFDAFLSADRTKTFFHGHSFTANPLACTAALASLDLLEEKSCRDKIKWIAQMHKDFRDMELSVITDGYFRDIRILGTILAFEINTGQDEYLNEISAGITREALSRGIYMRPLGNTVYLMPPYCISPEQLRKIYDFILAIPELSEKHKA